MIDLELLKNEADKLGVDLGVYGADRFDAYAERLVSWNKHVNLTSITEPDDIVIKHFIDSLYLCKYIDFKEDQKVIDVGSGAGFPGLPVFIANPDIQMTFLDCSGKRLGFLKDVCNTLGLIAERKHERAEDLGKDAIYREQYDYALARAVAPLNVLTEYCLPFVKVGGLFVALKGSNGQQELAAAQKAIKKLGGEVLKADDYKLPNGDGRSIIIIRKVEETPSKYPRKPKKIDSSPL